MLRLCQNGVILLIILCGLTLVSCRRKDDIRTSLNTKFPFQDPSLPLDDRLHDLVDIRLSIDELVPQSKALYGDDNTTPAIPRLGIKPYAWITECLSGVRWTNGTAFPQPIGMSSSFSNQLLREVATAISTEVRAFWNSNRKRGVYKQSQGLTCYSPVINIMRHPFWGRNTETYGEDPYLTGKLAQSYVTGLQGNHPFYVRASATCKHFDVHDGPENIPVSRFTFDAKVSRRDWRMTFLPAFKACVQAGAIGLMCSYNSFNGVPTCANRELLTDIPRSEWRYAGFVVSDAGAIPNIKTGHHYLNSSADISAAAINAGCNQELGSSVFDSVIDAINQKKLTSETFRESMKRVFYVRMRYGEFDPEDFNPYNRIDMSSVQTESHRELAVQMASASFVLLKNENNTLPLRKMFNNVAFLGPMAHNASLMYGTYSPDIGAFSTTPLSGLTKLALHTTYAAGCNDTRCNKYNRESVQTAVTGADLVFVCLGLGHVLESESRDRSTLALPGQQQQLLEDAVNFANGVPVILLLFNACPLDVSWAKNNAGVSAIMECFYPGQGAGEALYRSLTAKGPSSVPAGRLTATWPITDDQVPPITNYNMSAGFTYRYFHGDPLFPFGYGLSYTTFRYERLSLSKTSIIAGDEIQVYVSISNIGSFDADEVVQIYMKWNDPAIPSPKHQLVAFRRIHVQSGQRLDLQPITITSEEMQIWIDDDRKWVVPPGTMTLYAGGQQPNQITSNDSNILRTQFTIESLSKSVYTTFNDN